MADVLSAAGDVAANTSQLDALLVTSDAAAALKAEAMRHAALVEAL